MRKGIVVPVVDPDTKWWFRVGGLCAIAVAILYLLIVMLYVLVGGAIPSGAEEILDFIGGHTAEWWAIIALSVLTNFLYLPVALSLYLALKEINRNAMLVGAGLLVLFAIMENAVSWPIFSSLVVLSDDYAAATSDAQRTAILGAAWYASSMIGSALLSVYSILVPALGELIIGFVMLGSTFGKATAYLAVVAGILGIVSVVGSFFIDDLGQAIVIGSVFAMIWFLFAGYRLFRLGQENPRQESG
jgi:hypothetical protein